MAETPQNPLLDRLALQEQFGSYEPQGAPDDLPNIPFRAADTPSPNILTGGGDPPVSAVKLLDAAIRSKGDGRLTGGSIPRSIGELTSPRYDSFVAGDYNNEDAYAQGQGWTEKMVNGVGKGLALTGSTFLQGTVGLVNGLVNWGATGNFSSFYDNEFNRALDDINKELEENYLPNYETDVEKNANWYSPDNLFTANFLWNGIVKNLGFAAGAALSGGVYSMGIKALSSLPGISRLISVGKIAETAAATESSMLTASRAADTYGKIKSLSDRFLTSYKFLTPGGRAVVAGLSTTGEAGFEALQTLNDERQRLIQEYMEKNNGVYPDAAALQQINDKAADLGNSVFGLNVALLTATNYIQFPKIFASSYKAEKGIINSVTKEIDNVVMKEGKYVAEPFFKNRILSTINKIRPYTFSASEGFEEGAQFAIGKGVEDYYKKKNNNEPTSFLDSVIAGVKETLTSDEGAESILIGGISGTIMQARGTYLERKEKAKSTAEAIKEFNKYKLSDFSKDTIAAINRGTVLQQEREELLKSGDILSSKDKEADYVINYLSPRIKYGRFDLVKADIQDLKTLAATDQGFAQLIKEGKALETDTREAFLARVQSLEQTAENVKSLYQSLNLRYGSLVNDKGERMFSNEVVDKMVYAASKVADYDIRIPKLYANVVSAGIENIDQIINDTLEGKSDSFNAAIEKIKQGKLINEDEVAQNLEDVVELNLRRDAFLKEYNDIKQSPQKYKDQETKKLKKEVPGTEEKPGEFTIEDGRETPGDGEEQLSTVVTKTGDKSLKPGIEYVIASPKVFTETDIDKEVKTVRSFKFLGENEDGTLKIETDKGEIKDISKDALKNQNLATLDFIRSDKTANYWYNHKDEKFVFNFGKNFGGEKEGRIEYRNGRLYFVYLNSKGKIERKLLEKKHFEIQGNFKRARIRREGRVATTEEQAASEKAYMEDQEARKKETLARSRDLRLGIISELQSETKTRVEELNKKIENKKKELETIQKDLDGISREVAISEPRTKREKALEAKYPELSRQKVKFSKVLSSTSKSLTKLSRMKESVENELAKLNAEKEDLEFNLSYFEDFSINLSELPEDRGEFLKELKEQVEWLGLLVKETGENINTIASVGKSIENSIKDLVKLLEDALQKFDSDYPQYIRDNLADIKGGNFIIKNFTDLKEYLADLALMSDVQKEISVNENKLQEVNEEINNLYQKLEELGKELNVKSEIAKRFQEVHDAFEKRKAEEEKIAESEKIRKEVLGTADTSVQTIAYNKEFEPSPKKSTEILPRATIGVMRGKPHQKRANTFGFNLRKFPNRDKIRGIYVTSKNEDQFVPGLMDRLRMDERGVIDESIDKDSIIAMVMVEVDDDGNFTIIGEDGQPISEGANVLDSAIYQVYPDENLRWSSEFGGDTMFRKGTPDEVIDAVTAQYKEWRKSVLENPTGELHTIEASFGIPEYVKDEEGNINYDTRTSVEDANLISESDLEKDVVVIVPTLATTPPDIANLSKGTVSMNVKLGTVALETANGYVLLNNRKQGEEQANVIFEAILQYAKNMINPEVGTSDPKSERLLNWLKSVVYWGIPHNQDGSKKPAGYNSIFFEEDPTTKKLMLVLSGKGKSYRFTPTNLENNREEITMLISNLYNNINSHMVKQLNEPYEEILSIDKDGNVISRTWQNYQTYLVSNKTPDGKKRSDKELPLSTLLKPVKENEENRTGIYFFTTDTADDYEIPVIEKKKVVTAKTIAPGRITKTPSTPTAPPPVAAPSVATPIVQSATAQVNNALENLSEFEKDIKDTFKKDSADLTIALTNIDNVRKYLNNILTKLNDTSLSTQEREAIANKLSFDTKVPITSLDGVDIIIDDSKSKRIINLTNPKDEKEFYDWIEKLYQGDYNENPTYVKLGGLNPSTVSGAYFYSIGNRENIKHVYEGLSLIEADLLNNLLTDSVNKTFIQTATSRNGEPVLYTTIKHYFVEKAAGRMNISLQEYLKNPRKTAPTAPTASNFDIEAKKAEIERRRQEEFKKQGFTLSPEASNVERDIVGNMPVPKTPGLLKFENPKTGTIIYTIKNQAGNYFKVELFPTSKKNPIGVKKYVPSSGKWVKFSDAESVAREGIIKKLNEKENFLAPDNSIDESFKLVPNYVVAEDPQFKDKGLPSDSDESLIGGFVVGAQKKPTAPTKYELNNTKYPFVINGKTIVFSAKPEALNGDINAITLYQAEDFKEVKESFEKAGKNPRVEVSNLIIDAIKAQYGQSAAETTTETAVETLEKTTGKPVNSSVKNALRRARINSAGASDAAYRLALIDRMKSFKPENWNDVEKWLKANFPNVPVYRVKNVIKSTNGKQAWGMFQDGAIYIYENAEVGTVYHEVFHAVWRMFSDPQEQAAVLDEMRQRAGSFYDVISGENIKYSQATERQLEEKLAEEFRDYIQFKKIPPKPSKGRPNIVKLFSDLKTFIKEMFFNRNSPSKVEEMFKRIGTGYYKKTIPLTDSLSFANAGVINIDDVLAKEDAALSQIFGISDREKNDIIQEMTYKTLKLLVKDNASLFEIPNLNKTELYEYLKDEILDRIAYQKQEFEDMKNIPENERDFSNEDIDVEVMKNVQLMDNVAEEWEKIVERHEEYLKGYQIEFDENDDFQLTSDERSKESGWHDATKIDSFRKANSAIKILLATIPITLENGNIDRSMSTIGGATLLPVSQTYITLMNALYSSDNIEVMIDRLGEIAKNDRNYRSLYKRITRTDYANKADISKIDTEHGAQLLSAMWSTFKKQNPDVKNVFILENGDVVVGEANLSTAARSLKNQFVNSIIAKARKNEGYFKYNSEDQTFIGIPKKVNTLDLSSSAAQLKFLEELGIPFTKDDYKKINTSQKQKLKEAIVGVRKSIVDSKPVATFSGKSLEMDNRLFEIALVKAAATNPEFSSTYFNIVGEKTQSYIGTNAASDLSEFLSSLTVFNDESVGNSRYRYLRKDSFSKYSNVLSRMFASDGSRKKDTEDLFKIGIVGGSTNEEKGKRKESSKLTFQGRLIQELNLNLQGWYLNLVPGDASIEWMIKMGNPISIKNLDSGMDGVYQIFKGYFLSELELAREDRPVAKDRNGKEMRFFLGILGKELHDGIIKQKGSLESIYKNNEDKINAKINEFIQDDMQKLKTTLTRYGIMYTNSNDKIQFKDIAIKGEMDVKKADQHLKMLTVNYMIANIEMHKLLYSDPYQYADELKRIKNFNSPRQSIIHSSKKMSSVFDKVWNKAFPKGDIGYTNFTRDYFRSATHADVIGVIDLPNYKDFKETDGSGIITMKGNRQFRIRAGKWNSDEERQYKYDVAYEKFHKGLDLTGLEEFLDEYGMIDPKKDPNVPSAYTPLKPIVSGSILDKNGSFSNINNVVLDKLALYPLSYKILREMNESSNAMKLYEKMQKEDIDYVVFESARKVGVKGLHSTYNTNGSFNNTPYEKDVILNVPFSIMSIQAEVPSKETNTVTRGSQMTKLVTLDLMEAGIPVDFEPNKIFTDRYKKWYSLTNKEDYLNNGGENIYNLVNKNKDLLEALIEEGYKTTLKTLGIENRDGEFVITDMSKAAKTLRDEIFKREVNDNISESLESFLEGKIILEATPAYQQIRNILYSIADKDFISPKINGGMKVQIPSTLLESERVEIKEINGKKGYTSDILNFYEKDGERVAEVMVARWFDSDMTDDKILDMWYEKDANGKRTDVLTKEGKKALGGIAYRIPTQKQNSIDKIVIKKFLPIGFKDSVVIPAALVQKAGSDFDIDKLSMYFKNIIRGKNGKPVVVKYMDNTNSTARERFVVWVKKNASKETRKYIKFLTKDALNNLKKNYEIELAKIEAQYQFDLSEGKESLYQEMLSEIKSSVQKETFEQEVYLNRLFEVGEKVFFSMSENARLPFWDVKQQIREDGISGPREIARYLSLASSMVNFSTISEEDKYRLGQLIQIYSSELETLGMKKAQVDAIRKQALDEFRKNKEDYKKTLQLANKPLFEEVEDIYDQAKNEEDFQATLEIAKIDGLISLEEFEKLPINQQNIKEALENEYIQNLENIVGHPLNYNNLIKPNSAKSMEDLSKKIAAKVAGNSFDYKKVENMLDRTFMSSLRHAFVTGKYAIGIAAVNQTNHSLNQLLNMYFDKNRIKNLSDEDKYWIGNGDIKFDAYNRISVGGKMMASLSMIKNQAGEYISDIIGMFIDGYVDISKGPWIMELGATPNVASTWLTLVKVGVPIETVAYFMNQPIIREYLQKLDSSGYSWLFIDNFVNEISKSYGHELSEADYAKKAETFKIPSKQKLWENLGKDSSELNADQRLEQVMMLREFLKYAKMAEQLFHVTQGTNFDTASFNDSYLVFKKSEQLEKARRTIISSVDDFLESSFIGKLREKLNDVRNAFSTILTSDRTRVRNIIQNVLRPYVDISDREFVKLSQKAVNDLFDWAVQTHQDFNLAVREILIEEGGVSSEVSDFINSVKGDPTHPLYENEVIRILESVPSRKGGENSVNNLQLNIGDNKVYNQNNVIYGFRELKSYLKEIDSPLYDRIVSLAILQNGLSASPYSFTSLLPYEDFEKIYNKTLSMLETIPNLENFYKLGVFQRNNWYSDDIVPHTRAFVVDTVHGPVYNPSMNFLDSNVKDAVAENKIPPVMTFSANNREGNSDYIVYSWQKENLSKKDKEEMRRRGDFSYLNKGLFKKVYDEFGNPYTMEKKGRIYFVYKAINAWGDSFRANEFYDTAHKSQIDNGFIQVEEASDATVLSYFLKKVKSERPTKETSSPTDRSATTATIQMQTANIEKIKAGKKTTTTRSQREFDNIKIPVGKSATVNFGGQDFTVINRGLLSIAEAGGVKAMLKSEGYATINDLLYQQTKDWMNGKGKLYVYDIKPIKPGVEELTPKEKLVEKTDEFKKYYAMCPPWMTKKEALDYFIKCT